VGRFQLRRAFSAAGDGLAGSSRRGFPEDRKVNQGLARRLLRNRAKKPSAKEVQELEGFDPD